MSDIWKFENYEKNGVTVALLRFRRFHFNHCTKCSDIAQAVCSATIIHIQLGESDYLVCYKPLDEWICLPGWGVDICTNSFDIRFVRKKSSAFVNHNPHSIWLTVWAITCQSMAKVQFAYRTTHFFQKQSNTLTSFFQPVRHTRNNHRSRTLFLSKSSRTGAELRKSTPKCRFRSVILKTSRTTRALISVQAAPYLLLAFAEKANGVYFRHGTKVKSVVFTWWVGFWWYSSFAREDYLR